VERVFVLLVVTLLHLVAFKKKLFVRQTETVYQLLNNQEQPAVVLAEAVLAKLTGGLCQLDLHEERT